MQKCGKARMLALHANKRRENATTWHIMIDSLLWNLLNFSKDLWRLAGEKLSKVEKHVDEKNRQLIPQWSAFTYNKMYSVNFEQTCLWGIVCFVESYLKKPILLYEVIYERTRKEHSKKRTPLKRLLRFLDSQTNLSWVWLILGNLSEKSETVS